MLHDPARAAEAVRELATAPPDARPTSAREAVRRYLALPAGRSRLMETCVRGIWSLEPRLSDVDVCAFFPMNGSYSKLGASRKAIDRGSLERPSADLVALLSLAAGLPLLDEDEIS